MGKAWLGLGAAALLLAPAAAAAQAGAVAGDTTLSLAEAVRRAADNALGVRTAALQVAEAQARARQARSALLPGVAATAAYVNQDQNLASLGFELPSPPGSPPPDNRIGPIGVYDTRLRATQTVFDAAAIARLRAARAVVPAAEAGQLAAAEGAAQRAAVSYLRAALADATVAARAEDIRLAEELTALARQQLEQGVGTGIDVTRAEAQLAAARGAQIVARSQLAAARIALARALGGRVAAPAAPRGGIGARTAESSADTTLEAAVAQALANRPELRAAEARARAARLAGSAVRAERLPSVGLSANYGINGPNGDNLLDTHQVAVQVSVPVFEGERLAAREQEQAALAREAELGATDLRLQVEAEVRTALLDLASAQARQEIAAERRRLAESELAQARERFANGIAGNIEVINAQAALVRARDAVIEARFAAAAARVELARAVGVARTIR